jgi:hypothetical protein
MWKGYAAIPTNYFSRRWLRALFCFFVGHRDELETDAVAPHGYWMCVRCWRKTNIFFAVIQKAD